MNATKVRNVRDFIAKIFGFRFNLNVVEKTYQETSSVFNLEILRVAAKKAGIPFTADEEAKEVTAELEEGIQENNKLIPEIREQTEEWIKYYQGLIESKKEAANVNVGILLKNNLKYEERIKKLNSIFGKL